MNRTQEAPSGVTQEASLIPMSIRVMCGLVLGFLILPIAVVVMISFSATEEFTFPSSGLSLRWMQNFFETPSLLDSMLFSMKNSLFAAILASTIGTLTAVWLVGASRRRSRGLPVVAVVLALPVIMPAIALGFALLVSYRQLGLGSSSLGLVLAQTTYTVPFVAVLVTASLHSVDTDLELAARSLGAGRFETFRRITLPMVVPGVTAGFLFAFLLSFGQSELARYITPPNESTFPVALYQYLLYRLDPTPAAAGTLSIIFTVLLVLVLNLLTPLGRLSTRQD